MTTLNRQIFAIVNTNKTKVLTEIGWVGLFLSNPISTDELIKKLYDNIPAQEFMYERRSDSYDYIQYYSSFERASAVIHEVSTRSNKPITEPMCIIVIDINISSSIQTLPVFENHQDLAFLDQFEGLVSGHLNMPLDTIKEYRNKDFVGYTNKPLQRAYTAWLDLTLNNLEESE